MGKKKHIEVDGLREEETELLLKRKRKIEESEDDFEDWTEED